MIALTIALVLAAAPSKHTYGQQLRVAYLEAALDAVQAAPPEVLVQVYGNLAVYERGSCAASSQRLRVECLMTAARRFCFKRPKAEAKACALYTDVVVSNLIAEKQLISTDTRYELMKRARQWRREMALEIRRMQGALAADFALQTGVSHEPKVLASKIDAYCAQSADENNLAWQTCAASLLWFIGAPGLDVEPRKGE